MPDIKQGQSSFEKLKRLSQISLFRSIKVYPKVARFDGQDTHETIILFLRQHPVVLVPAVFRSLMIFAIGLIISLGIGAIADSSGLKMGASIFVLMTFVVVVAVTNMFFSFLQWYYTVFIITTTRLIDIDFLTLFDASMSSTLLEVIQDVSKSSPGFFSTLFDMGSIMIQTAGENNKFEISNVPRPRDVLDILMDLIENLKKNDS
ncbi:MAG: hypothetical protein QY314_02355 [Candidatus Dojkabacteria bacterium]|nr:MAG: hypothetical protein QY314_02355 [Candidatus Dojkabacteria bacterium]